MCVQTSVYFVQSPFSIKKTAMYTMMHTNTHNFYLQFIVK